MQNPILSLRGILAALDLDDACIPSLERTRQYRELHGHTPEAVYAAIRTIGTVLNASPKADRLAENLEERLNIISHKLKFITNEHKPTVLFLSDVSPMDALVNEYLDHLTRIAGGIPLGKPIDMPNPDVIIIVSEKPVPQLLAALPKSLNAPEWSKTAAVRNGRVYLIHQREYLRRPGALIADDAEILAEILQPKYFIFGRDEDAWMKFEWH